MWDSSTPPSRSGLDILSIKFTGLDICKWLNNNHTTDSNTILELNRPNLILKTNSLKKVVQTLINIILTILLNDAGP